MSPWYQRPESDFGSPPVSLSSLFSVFALPPLAFVLVSIYTAPSYHPPSSSCDLSLFLSVSVMPSLRPPPFFVPPSVFTVCLVLESQRFPFFSPLTLMFFSFSKKEVFVG